MAYIMVVDDDEDLVSAVAKALREDGHEVQISLDTKGAEKRMEARRPDLLILDVMFPGDSTSGFTFARTLKHYNEKLKGIPILMMTGVNNELPYGFSERDIDDDWLPVSCFLEKPVDLKVMTSKVTELLAKAAAAKGDAPSTDGEAS